MANRPYHAVTRQVDRLFRQGAATGTGECELLHEFLERGDEIAFEAIVARHGPVVLRVCRQLLDDPNDVDDAFQATFLILVRKARSIRHQDALGGWLYGVAHRVAIRARQHRMPRCSGEHDPEKAVDTCQLEQDEIHEAVRDELNRLPQKYRMPIVLCYLEGLSHVATAERLGWPVGTVRGRMARGRDLLRDRLTRRGLTLSASTVALLTVSDACSAPLSQSLIECTVRAASRTVQRLSASGTLSAQAIALTEGVLTAMLWNKLKLAALAVVALPVLAVGVAVLARQLPAATSDLELSRRAARAETPASSPPNGLAVAFAEQAITKNAQQQSSKANAPPDPSSSRGDYKALRAQITEKLTDRQAEIELLEIRLQAEKDELQELMKLIRTKERETAQPVIAKSAREVELAQKARSEELRFLGDRLENLEHGFPENHRRIARVKREAEQLKARLEELEKTSSRPDPARASSSAAKTSSPSDAALGTRLEETRLDLELLKQTVESEHTQLLQAHKLVNQFERGPYDARTFGGPPRATPAPEAETKQANEAHLRLQKRLTEHLRSQYLGDKARLVKAEAELADLELKAGTSAKPAEPAGEIVRRLDALEKKLDQLVEALDKPRK